MEFDLTKIKSTIRFDNVYQVSQPITEFKPITFECFIEDIKSSPFVKIDYLSEPMYLGYIPKEF